MSQMDFSSWPRDQEASFLVYENRRESSQKQAWTFAIIGAVVVLLGAVGIYMGVEPDNKDLSKGMNMSNLTKKKSGEAAPAPAPDKK